ncbi:MAG: vanadium-dependent haloperoxidase [Deinococcales bacterium]
MKQFLALIALCSSLLFVSTSGAQNTQNTPLEMQVATQWYTLMLDLTRHTATYSPPVAARSFAYLGLAQYEIVAGQSKTLRSMAGQLNNFTGVAKAPNTINTAAALHGALSSGIEALYGNTGPVGQRVFTAFKNRLSSELQKAVPTAILEPSFKYGQIVMQQILDYANTDGGANISNLGFPLTYPQASKPQDWIPTTALGTQQTPLLPDWGKNRPLVMKTGNACPLPAPPVYSSEKGSAFYNEALEVYTTTKTLTPEQRKIAHFWSDDPMLSVTPPGHWVSIALNLALEKNLTLTQFAELQVRLGLAVNDAFIGCWHTKYEYNLLRPITYIHRHIDPTWEAVIFIPPFPEYPSGHSTQSAAAASVLTAFFGENYAFTDRTGMADGHTPRSFGSFAAAAAEASISRLYGGVHFRSAIVRGYEQGSCIGAKINALLYKK